MRRDLLAPLFLAGCADPVIGEWNLLSLDAAPLSSSYDGCTSTIAARLELRESGSASMLQTYSYAGNCYYADPSVYAWEGEIDILEAGEDYAIKLAAGAETLALSCTLGDDADRLWCVRFAVWEFGR